MPFRECPIVAIRQYGAFSAWLLSLVGVHLRFPHVFLRSFILTCSISSKSGVDWTLKAHLCLEEPRFWGFRAARGPWLQGLDPAGLDGSQCPLQMFAAVMATSSGGRPHIRGHCGVTEGHTHGSWPLGVSVGRWVVGPAEWEDTSPTGAGVRGGGQSDPLNMLMNF